MMVRCVLILLLNFSFTLSAHALTLEEPLPDAAQEARAKTLFMEFRCVVCQSESVHDSPAEVARDLRAFVRREIAAGKSDDDIRNALVSRYGDFILMRPPLNQNTALLWAAPLVMLLIGVIFLLRYFRRRQ